LKKKKEKILEVDHKIVMERAITRACFDEPMDSSSAN